MDITINVTDGVPIYRQIVNQVKYLVASGLLLPSEELPPIRTLALQLKVTPNTIVKAYGELESSGVVHKRRGSGTFVSEGRQQLALRGRGRIIEQRIEAPPRRALCGRRGVSSWRFGNGAALSSSASTPCWPRRTS